jgi:hypothetical protein
MRTTEALASMDGWWLACDTGGAAFSSGHQSPLSSARAKRNPRRGKQAILNSDLMGLTSDLQAAQNNDQII